MREFLVRRGALDMVANKQTSCSDIVRLRLLWWIPLFDIEDEYIKERREEDWWSVCSYLALG